MRRIVILDDSQLLRTQWKKILSKEGYMVEDAVNTHQLMSVLVEKEVDLLILDLFLGSEQGFHVIKRLKEDPTYSKIPIIVATPERRRVSIEEVIELGINDYLIKPVDLDLLKKRIKRIFTKLETSKAEPA